MFNSEFCTVNYVESQKIILLTWKKFCNGDNYRNPVMHALELLKSNKNSNIIIDARNGFEDDKEDVEWGFSTFIPLMAKTDCKYVIFIMNRGNDIEGEMDMWTREFMKYFTVISVENYQEAIEKLKDKF